MDGTSRAERLDGAVSFPDGTLGPRMERNTALAGRRVLVVGASSGIGRALALAARIGGPRGPGASAPRPGGGGGRGDPGGRGRARAWRCDVTDVDDCRKLVEGAAEFMGGIDLVLYLSGASTLLKVAEASPAQWHELLATNLVGAATVVARRLPTSRPPIRPWW